MRAEAAIKAVKCRLFPIRPGICGPDARRKVHLANAPPPTEKHPPHVQLRFRDALPDLPLLTVLAAWRPLFLAVV
jgi:hypothetical protein